MKDENRMCDNHTYHCAICGKTYYSVQERMNCEMKCLKAQKEAEEKAALEQKNKEQARRKAEVDEAFKNLLKLHDAYVKDYGYYEFDFEEERRTISLPCWPSKIWHSFFF